MAKADVHRLPPDRRSRAIAAVSGCCGKQEARSSAAAQAPAAVCARYSTSVIVMVIGAPTPPCGRIIRRGWIVRRGGWVVAVVGVRVIVGVREHGAKRKGSEPNPDGGTRAHLTCICGPRHRREPHGCNDRCGDGQPPTSLPKGPANGHKTLLRLAQPCTLAPKLRYKNERTIFSVPNIPCPWRNSWFTSSIYYTLFGHAPLILG